MNKTEKIIKVLKDVEELLYTGDELSFILHSFVYGSVSKRCYTIESDIDLLLIGDKPKTIDVLGSISKLIDEYTNDLVEVDIKYYYIEDFRKLRSNNAFLLSIEKNCKTIEEVLYEFL